MMNSLRGSTTVNILGKKYRITCAPGEEDALMQSARLVDQRMQDIRQQGKVIGTDRIAVMAALNLAHELINQTPARPTDSTELSAVQKRLRGLREQVDDALDQNKNC